LLVYQSQWDRHRRLALKRVVTRKKKRRDFDGLSFASLLIATASVRDGLASLQHCVKHGLADSNPKLKLWSVVLKLTGEMCQLASSSPRHSVPLGILPEFVRGSPRYFLPVIIPVVTGHVNEVRVNVRFPRPRRSLAYQRRRGYHRSQSPKRASKDRRRCLSALRGCPRSARDAGMVPSTCQASPSRPAPRFLDVTARQRNVDTRPPSCLKSVDVCNQFTQIDQSRLGLVTGDTEVGLGVY
jgi:hypothetical protein